jgi:anhydro-N-acetylmuramic acid kinase
MSGTSLDGADVVLVGLDDANCELRAARTIPFPTAMSVRLRTLTETGEVTFAEVGTLDVEMGQFFADCVMDLVKDTGTEKSEIEAIGYSGHTVFHKPEQPHAFTMQLGDPNTIAAATGIDTVADLRRMDVAYGGQGAPLTPTFHDWRFAAPDEIRIVLNLGGVANITVLDPKSPLTGFDTGPANSLLDAWCRKCWDERFDDEGRRARQGSVEDDFLAILILDVLSTLTELTAVSAGDAIISSAPGCERTIVCGGGTFNTFLIERLQARIPGCRVESSAAHGIAPEWVEAIAFAWLARKRLENQSGNAPSVTGSRQTAVLGGLYSGTAEN